MRKKILLPFIFAVSGFVAFIILEPINFFSGAMESPTRKTVSNTSAQNTAAEEKVTADYREEKQNIRSSNTLEEKQSSDKEMSDKESATAEKNESMHIVYADDLLSVVATDYPLSLILQEVGRLTGIAFHIDRNVERYISSFDIREQPLQEAIGVLLDAFTYTLTFDSGVFHTVGVYMPGTDYDDMAEFFVDAEDGADFDNTVPENATKLHSAFLYADQKQAERLIVDGLISPDQDIRALSLWTAIQRGARLPRHEFEALAQRDPSPIVRSIALQGLLGGQDLSANEKLDFARLMTSDTDESVRNTAEDYIAFISHGSTPDDSSQSMP